MGIMDLFNKKEKDADEISVKEQMKQDASARENIEIEVSGTEKYRKEAQIRHISDIVKNPLNKMRIEFYSTDF